MPVIKGPAVVVKDADLLLVSQYDSVTIQKTNGVVSMSKNVFVGRGGKFDWVVNGNEASVALKKYTFNINRSEFVAEGAELSFPAVLEEPIEGVFEYKSRKRNTTADTGFPRFASFTNNARLKNLGENIVYRGGFSLAGAKIMSAALDNSFSTILVKHNGEKKFRTTARNYSLGDTLISSRLAGIAIYQEKDSITHPGMEFKYSRARNQLKLIKDDGAFRNSKFLDTYHKMEIAADLLIWNVEKPEVNFSILRAKNEVAAMFESQDYFSDTKYQQLKGISSFHPLQMIVGYANLKKTDRFFATDVAKANKIKEIAVKRSMSYLAREGYIDYNGTTGFVILKPKALHYVNSARNKKDFDHISIQSTAASGKNATLNLEKKELLIRGIRQFSFSTDSGAIVVRPDSGIVYVKKNRDMDFGGRVITPNFIFKGSDFEFSYDNFWIDMPKIDSLIFRTKKNKKGKEKLELAAGQEKVNPDDPAKPADPAKTDELAQVDFPDDYPEDDSVQIRKKMAVKAEKKKLKEEKKKA
ncbi:MAG TPA: hypothetical protein VK927_03030, partial [Adhaeribacter sp.]|nr:hypothetical protein [Adhaeribacter sp.]